MCILIHPPVGPSQFSIGGDRSDSEYFIVGVGVEIVGGWVKRSFIDKQNFTIRMIGGKMGSGPFQIVCAVYRFWLTSFR